MPPASGGAKAGGGGGNVWGQILQGVLEGVMQKMTQKTGPPPEAAPKGGSAPAEAKPDVNPQQQSAPPMSGQMLDLLSKLSSKMNAQVPQGPQPKGQQPAAQTTAGVGAAPPPQQPPQPAAPSQEGFFRRVMDGITKEFKSFSASPMGYTRGKLEGLNKAIDDPDELIAEGREQGGFRGRSQAAFGGVLKGLGRDRPLTGAGDVMGAAGDAAGGIPVVGKSAEQFFKLNEVLFKSIDRLKAWGDRLHEGNIRFAEFSGQMFAVAKEQEAREIQLSMKKGEDLAASARFQAEQKARLETQTMFFENFLQKTQNYISGFISKTLADLIKKTPFGAEELEEGGQGMLNWMRDLEEMESKREGSLIPPPKRWGPG